MEEEAETSNILG